MRRACAGRHGSLSATARALRVNHATVSRKTDAAEAELGRLLFERRFDGYALTPEGRSAVEKAQVMETAALAMRDAVGPREVLTGTVRITTVRSLADAILTELLRIVCPDRERAARLLP